MDVTEDASLDQFVSSGKTDESGDDGSADSDAVGAADSEADSPDVANAEVSEDDDIATADAEDTSGESSADDSAVEPAVSTFQWSSDGGECADCGASVERRWRGDGQKDGNLVCSDCKEW